MFFLESLQESKLVGYSDSNWTGSCDDMKSTSSHLFTFSASVFTWSSKKQDVVTQSTAEVKYIATSAAMNQALWLRKLLEDLKQSQFAATEIRCDNMSTIAIAKKTMFHSKTKNFKIKYHFFREVQ